MRPTAARFAAELRDPLPERLALVIAQLAYPDLDPGPALALLDEMAGVVARRVERMGPGEARAVALLDALRSDLGFRGNQTQYYAAENSFLNVVLAQRTGLPILLAVVCMAVGRRLGLQVEGMGFPGHFMVRYRDPAGSWLVDLFHGAVVPPETAAAYLGSLYGREVELPVDAFAPVTPQALALRILNNLRSVYVGQGDHKAAAHVVELMLVVTPDSTLLWQEHGMLSHRSGDDEGAVRSLRRYFYLLGRLASVYPPLRVLGSRSEPLSQSDRHLIGVLHEIEAERGRTN
jgi:regulator of sirC expression with transglutaminase-like and TPR domain